MMNQINNFTFYDRYPIIFKACQKIIGDKELSILSFGCSTCEEIITLKELYFTKAQIYGVEINALNIQKCCEKIDPKYIMHYDDFLFDTKKFDLIFAMSCLCRWQGTKSVLNSTRIYPFVRFDNMVEILDEKLLLNGYIVIYNSNYIFEDTDVSLRYEKINCNEIKESGDVHKFDKNNIKIINSNYDGVIFRKANNKRIIHFL